MPRLQGFLPLLILLELGSASEGAPPAEPRPSAEAAGVLPGDERPGAPWTSRTDTAWAARDTLGPVRSRDSRAARPDTTRPGAPSGDLLPAALPDSAPVATPGGDSLAVATQDHPLRLGLQPRPLPFSTALGGLPPASPLLATSPALSRAASSLGGVGKGAGGAGGGRADGRASSPDPALFALPQEAPSLLQSDFARMDVRLRGRGEMGGDWSRFEPCESGLQRSCDPGLIPQLKPDVQFGIQVGGTLADRIHVDVDYDEAREFSATNKVNIWYEAPPGEVIQRVEVGDVTLLFPESRFLTQGIPAGNFGFRAVTELGPLSVQTVWAQQNGDLSSREFRLSDEGGREAFVQEDTLVLDDADYVRGQFFFLLDPREIVRFPHLDVLSLDPGSAPPTLAPGAEPIQLYRFENDPVTRQQVEGYIQARAEAERDGNVVRESGWFRYLQPGTDYFLHSSGLWLALRRPLRQEEMLAVAYITATGDSIGDYNPERIHNAGGTPTLRLLKASGPVHQPGSPTWEMEMHQVYRISGSDDVDPASVDLSVSLGELSGGRTFKRGPTGEEVTLLRLLGLDEESPVDEVDPAFVYRPAQDFFEEQPPVSGTYLVFPTLRPFAEPPPLRSLGLTAEETREILGADANPTIYEAVDPVVRDNGGLYRLTLPFRIRTEGFISTFSLGALGIRDGSERIWFGDRLLVSGEDYLIDYDIGQVTLLSPEALFGTDPRGRVRASWEQKALFQVAPTSIFGFNARYGVGDRGGIHLVGLYQREQSLQNRPQLGVEPGSVFLGGVNGRLEYGAHWLDRLAGALPGAGADSLSSLKIQGEMAVSLPNPNTRGDVYLDDFDAGDDLPLSLLSQDWFLGSAPEDRDGIDDLLPPALDGSSAGRMVWQHTWILTGPSADSVGVFEGFFPRRDIDQQINIAGTETRQTGLRLTFSRSPSAADRSWRSVTTVLSNTGTDLSRTDFLEFYAAGGDSLTLVLDLGRVSEDAFFVASGGVTGGVDPGTGEAWGLGILDQEADPRRGEIWNDGLDARGVWVEECEGARGRVYPLGDRSANCTRGNGRNDTEDLDGDGNLAQGERVFRYRVPLDGSSPYLARTRSETGTAFRLYRIPLRDLEALNVGGRFTEADWRAVKHLRITVVGSRGSGVSLARLRLVGSRWVRRGEEGILAGLAGDRMGSGGSVEVGPVSVLSEGSGYASPPGVLEELDDPSLAFSGGGVEFNEKSLQLEIRGLAPGERAEVYSRFPQRPRNFLVYRQARIWVVAPGGEWGGEGPDVFVKVGSDAENFYLYRSRRTAAVEGGVVAADWLPEVVVQFDKWLALRRVAEETLIREPPEPGGPPLEVWSADSTYAVFLKDRARAPNLAAVREISVGVWNQGTAPVEGRVWIDELRLSRAVRDPGVAGYLNAELETPGLLRTSLSFSGRGPFFRQLEGDPTYQENQALSVTSTLELGRVAPDEWGISLPVSVSYLRLEQDPTFLALSDVRTDRLPGLRSTGATETRVDVSLRKTTPLGVKYLDPVLEGLTLRAGVTRSRFSTTTLESEGSGADARVEFFRELPSRDLPLIPPFAHSLVEALLPQGAASALLGARFRWTPERIRLGTQFSRREREAYRFEQILVLPSDSTVVPTRSPRKALETNAQVSFRPVESVTAEATIFTVRDLLPPGAAVQDTLIHPLLQRERLEAGPVDLGWETNRNLRTRVGFRPDLASWLRTDLSLTTDYLTDRNANLVDRTVVGSDTLLLLQRNANGNRTTRATVSLDPGALVRALGGDPEVGQEGAGAPPRSVAERILGAVDPLAVTRQGGVSARFFREPVDPGAGFQLGWGDLEAFRFLGADTATLVTGRTAWTAQTGVRLPLSVRITGGYTDSRTDLLHVRSDQMLRTRSWPDLRVSMGDVPLPGWMEGTLRSLSLGSGYRRTLREATFGGVGVQRRALEEHQVPMEVTGGWAGDISTRYRGSLLQGDGTDPTGDTHTDRMSHSFLLSASLAAPPFLEERVDGPLRMTLGYQYSSETSCRRPAGLSECTAYLDYLIRSANVALDTVISPLEVGVHLTWTDRRSFVGRHDANRQFQLGIYGQFLFDGGAFVPPAGLGG